ncbi:FKBP-type peptidyl-prolyl cis-trans isomerase [Adhaeribacter sp. BT258]|uniref:Peptidyl-prolyl cis-trans isomerase n=1 Tax=Adhaeribacter terrigena TaxID=2793070 RepID=A0ABS1BZU4_9BACT|nr:FKBP-type peptidyl-prolyl cis-trans isomerase [Adhaeribacter terrigena]MBK0402676.1 FKBP-type peptidyl-prolyl cis-trans isomerase [Adhaeribacter terrigena]
MNTLKEKISYIIGRDMASNFSKQGIEIEADALLSGLKDAMAGKPSALSAEETQQTMMQLQQEMEQKFQEKAGKAGENNKKEGQEFLAANKNKAGVHTLPSGMQYEILNEGTGKTPSRTDNVTTHYKGTLIDGTVFDSSYERGQPATFPVNGVIAGWTQALMMMKEGAKWRLYIPAELAYGAQGAGADIGPNATLIFDVELLKVN